MEGPSLLQDSHNNNTRLGSPDNLKMSSADIEQFQGKIVYNPDGSAYIIEDADFSDDEAIDLPKQAGRIVEKPGLAAHVDQFPTIENAIYVAKNKSQNNYPSYVRAQTSVSDTRPSVHSYRVYNYRQKSSERVIPEPMTAAAQPDNIPVKPILMCFICKLSFGNTKAFKNHCKDEHSLEFNDDEGDMLQLENISALVQLVGPQKEPLISFLEPVVKGHYTMPLDQVPMRSPSKSPNEASGHIRVRNDLAGPHPQISPVSNGRSSEDSMSPAPNSFNPNGAAFPLKGTTIGGCPDHMQGRPNGVECAKCDMIINTNRLGQMGWNASNNACKTLKCPKCNWHYKYQETLEIHMKEKHPENETTCIYCITGQQHPRLARGETYTCGYKPYRCEICNYSTTTKGNLSIHMQSDKHINNMQEIQNGGGTSTPSPSPSQTSQFITPSGTPNPQETDKEKPCWRCDVCNYETNIARNLRIHMTSEKHMNNVMNLQQMNLGPNGLPNGDQNHMAGMMPPMPNMPGGPNLQQLLGMSRMPGPPGMPGSPMKEVAMADMAFNQALLMQMMGGQPGMPAMPPGFPAMPGFPGMPDQQEQAEAEQSDPNPSFLYNCAVCREFSCDHLQALSDHLAIDRSKLRETEVFIHIGGTYICKLCSYKTNLKANFQLHCKTDKHLQKLQLVNHIMEGGPSNEWKLNFMNVSNSVQLRCNACDFYTDSIHKLQIHSANQGHEVSSAIFSHMRKEEQGLKGSADKLDFTCTICKHSTPGKALLLQHCRSVKHLQMEQLHLLQLRAEGGGQSPEIGDIFTVAPMAADAVDSSADQENKDSNGAEEMKGEESEEVEKMLCPLCQEGFKSKATLEEHAMQLHSINAEGLQRLMMLMQGSHWLNSAKKSDKDEGEKDGDADTKEAEVERSPGGQVDKFHDPGRPYKCEVCRESFTQKSILLVHYNSVGHLRNLKKKMQEQTENSEANTTTESDLDKSGSSEVAEMSSPKKEEQQENNGQVLGEIQAALQQAMVAARLQMLNPMLRGMPPGMPPMNPLAMMGGMPNFPGMPGMPPGMPQLQQLMQMQQMQQMGGNQRMPDPAMILQQLSQLKPEKGGEKSPFPSPQQQQQQQQQFHQDMFGAEQKRARTKITEDQLKILRSYFDISNSPSDDQINLMAQQTGLPPKVIKHWFRNTLFKERQKNKDSPYNFNNPPSTMINLEEYEKTGESNVTNIPATHSPSPAPAPINGEFKIEDSPKSSPRDVRRDDTEQKSESDVPSSTSVTSHNNTSAVNFNTTNPVPTNVTQSSFEKSSLTLSSILSSQSMSMADSMSCLPNYPPPLPSPFGQSTEPNSFSKMLHNLAANTNMHQNQEFSEPSSPQSHQQRLSPGGHGDMGIHGKRANRTRFSDYQVKVLQEFFDKNAYPKDDDLEYLSKLLGLTPRVIVVWFQNARQKARKAYENQPSNEVLMDDVEGRFVRTPSLSYQCKKCNLEFQRYYELIRHQKQHCYKEEDSKRSALAQKAASACATQLNLQGAGLNMSAVSTYSEDSNSSISYSERNITSPVFNQSTMSWKRKSSTEDNRDVIEEPRSKLPKTTNLFPPMVPPTPVPSGPAGTDLEASMRKFYEDTMKRYMEEIQGRPQPKEGQALDLRSSSADLDHGSHRSENDNDSEENWDKTMSGGEDSSMDHQRMSSSDFDAEPSSEGGGGGGGVGGLPGTPGDINGAKDTGNKRFRTHMSNVQVKMMKNIFENYKTPTMPECLGLGNDIGLQKRVVQVWFQNARAKEKKARLYLQQVTGQEPELHQTPRDCRWCGLQFPENFAIQEHIFQKSHLEKVKSAIEQGLYDPESPGHALTQQAEALQNGGMLPQGQVTPPRHQDSATDSSPSPQKSSLGPGLSMMAQMAAGHGPDLPDSRSMLMPPFYGMNSYPIGVNTVHNV